MRKLNIALLSLLMTISFAYGAQSTKRVHQIDNAEVSVWKATIYPGSKQMLKMHRHDQDRVLIALTDGRLKIVSDKGETHYMDLQKDHSYFLTSDPMGEKHTDENVGKKAISMVLVQLKS